MRKAMLVLVFLVSALPLCAQPPAAPAPAPLTWLRFFTVDRAHTRDFTDAFNRIDAPLLDRLVANHQIAGWGLAVPLTDTGEGWTYMSWITMNNWSQADAIMTGMMEAMRGMSPSDQAMMETAVTAKRDVVLRHVSQAMALPAAGYTPHYIRASFYTVKPGRVNDATSAFNTYTAPVYTNLASRGAIGPWGLSTQEIVLDPSFTHVVWYFFDSLARLDDTRNALNNMAPDDRSRLMAAINDTTDISKYRSEILMILRMSPMAPPAH